MNISVVGLVVLAQLSAKLENAGDVSSREPREDKIFHLDDRLIRAVTGRKYLYKDTNRELNLVLIQKIVDMLVPRSIDPEHKRIGDSYRIVSDLGPGPNEVFHAYQAEYIYIPGRYARAKKYSTPSAFSTEDLNEAISRFQRDMQALVKLEHHPNIVKVYGYQPDHDSNDIYWLLLEWVKGITLQDRLDTGPDMVFQEQLQILYSILDALDCCHVNGILHRNLTPSCIYLANNGIVKLGDFDFARVPDLTTTLTFQVKVISTWTYQFSQAQQAQIKLAIRGKSKEEATTLLLHMPGVQTVSISTRNGDAIPTDVQRIHLNFVVLT